MSEVLFVLYLLAGFGHSYVFWKVRLGYPVGSDDYNACLIAMYLSPAFWPVFLLMSLVGYLLEKK